MMFRQPVPNKMKEQIRQICLQADKGIYDSYKGPCMAPALESDDFAETNRTELRHVIGQQFLGRIASNGKILSWPMNGYQLSKAILHVDWTLTDTIQPDIDSIHPQPIGTDDYACKSPFSCPDHDNRIFKPIDAPGEFDLTDQYHQFLLGFRGIAGSTAITEGALIYCREYKPHPPNRSMRRKFGPDASNQLIYFEKSLHISQERADILRPELRRWQYMYRAEGPRNTLSRSMSVRTRIRLAISSVTYEPGCLPIVVSVLPKASPDPAEPLCDIILTSRIPEATDDIATQAQEKVLEEQASKIKMFLNGEPSESIPAMLKALSMNPTSFFFVSPSDYNSISVEGRTRIEKEMGKVAQAFISP